MKSFILILISFLFFAFIGNKHPSDLEKINLKGKVKYVIVTSYLVKDRKPGRDSLENIDTTVYNRNGDLTEEDKYYDDSCLNYKVLYRHDSLDNRMGADIYNISLKEARKSTNMVDDFFGRPRSSHRRGGQLVLTFKVKTQNNELGNAVAEELYSAKDEFRNKWEWKYNDKGQKTEQIDYDAMNSFTGRHIYKYDNEGNTAEMDNYGLDSIPLSKITVQIDKKDKEDNWLKRTQCKNGKLYEIFIRKIEYYQ